MTAMVRHATALVFVLALSASLALVPVFAQQHVHPPASSGAQPTSSLTAEQVQQLLDGEGMGLAKAAELHGYPGPKHVLELEKELALSAEQRQRVVEIRERMLAEAKRLGTAVVEAERALDRAFMSGTVTPADLASRTAAIAELNGRLRATHLQAHLDAKPILSAEQTKKYAALRGHAH